MILVWSSIGVLILLALVICILVWNITKKRKLSSSAERKIRESWLLINQISDPVRKVLEADKVLDLALGLLGYPGSLGEKLKKAGARFSDLQGLWNAHKLRNTVAHEMQAQPSLQEVDRAMRSFERALWDLGMKK
jgi:hypothetical protein